MILMLNSTETLNHGQIFRLFPKTYGVSLLKAREAKE